MNGKVGDEVFKADEISFFAKISIRKSAARKNFYNLKNLMQELFRRFAVRVSRLIGSVWTFLIFITLLLITGFYFDFSSAWENNVSFIVAVITLSALFFLQKSQNHNDNAIQLKLDELIRAVGGARDEVAAVENETEKDLEKLKND